MKKKTSAPEWNEHLNVHANETSTLSFRLLQKAKLFEDTCLGMAKIKLANVGKTENGECEFSDEIQIVANMICCVEHWLRNYVPST